MNLGSELRFCPRKRPGMVWGLTAVVIGAALLMLMLAVMASDGMKASDREVMLVMIAICLGTGGLLLWLRQRTLAKRIAFRVHEHGVVRESRGERREVPFDQLARLQAVTVVYKRTGAKYHTVILVPREGAALRIDSLTMDNLDTSLIHLLEQRSGLTVEPLDV